MAKPHARFDENADASVRAASSCTADTGAGREHIHCRPPRSAFVVDLAATFGSAANGVAPRARQPRSAASSGERPVSDRHHGRAPGGKWLSRAGPRHAGTAASRFHRPVGPR